MGHSLVLKKVLDIADRDVPFHCRCGGGDITHKLTASVEFELDISCIRLQVEICREFLAGFL